MLLASFGQVIGTHEVCSDVRDALTAGFPTFLTEVRNAGGDLYEPPRDYQIVSTRDALKIAETPAVELSCPGWDDPPHRDEAGNYAAMFPVAAVVYVRDEDYEDTQRAASIYGLGLVALLVRAGFGAVLRESQVYGLDGEAARTMAAWIVVVDVPVDGVVSESGSGPFGAPPFGTVSEIDVDVERAAS